MKKIFLTILLLAVMLPVLGASVSAADYRMFQVQFCDERGEPVTDLSYVAVYNPGTVTAATLKAERAGTTAVTNPMTSTTTATGLRPQNGLAQFYSTKSTVDIIAHVAGRKVAFNGVKPSDRYFQVPNIVRNGGLRPKGAFDTFQFQPVSVKKLGAGPATGTAGDENLMFTGANILEYHILGTQTIVAPDRLAGGLDIGGMDQTADDGIEICPGILAGNGSAFTVGTDGPFHFKVRMLITDVSGTDDLAIGFRKAEAYQAAIDNYDEMAAFNVISGAIYTETIINGAATVSTDTTNTWADGATKTLEVKVALNGAVTYKINGVAPTTTVAYSFDTGEVVVPFIYFLQDTDITGDLTISEWDCGLD